MHLVDLVNDDGAVVGAKKRHDIQKLTDLYHTIFTILITPEKQLVLSKVPARTDLPNLYVGQLGCTLATIRRHDETSDEASLRSLENELYLKDITASKLGEYFQVLPDGQRTYISIYYVIHAVPSDFSHNDIEGLQLLTHQELVEAMGKSPDTFAPSFLAAWERFNKDLLKV